MTNKKTLLEHQKRRLNEAIEAISSPIFSTIKIKEPDLKLFSDKSGFFIDKNLPNSLDLESAMREFR